MFSFTYEKVILIEGQLQCFNEAFQAYGDHEYASITNKYVNTLFKITEEQAKEFDLMKKI